MISSKLCSSKLKSVFVTGTDTEVGKTVLTGLLGRYISEKGYKVVTQKWIQTGSADFPDDIDTHLKLMKLTRADIEECMPLVCPYVFEYASSPHLAAKLERRKISAAQIKNSFRALSQRFDCVIVEGIGGALVPFNNKAMVIDIAAQLNLPVLIIAGNKLGAINHTLLTIEAIRYRRMKTLGIIFNGFQQSEVPSRYEKGDKIILEDNPKIIKALTGERILGNLPWLKDQDLLYKAFIPIGEEIFIQLAGKP